MSYKNDSFTPDSSLEAVLREKVRAVTARERELNAIARTLAGARQWSEATAELAVRLRRSKSGSEAIAVLINVIPSTLRLDYIAVRWGALEASVGNLDVLGQGLDLELMLTEVATAATMITIFGGRGVDPQAGVRGLRIESLRPSLPAICLILGRAAQTARYYPGDEANIHERLTRFAHSISETFDNVLEREELVRERDGLQATVDTATQELRGALARAELAGNIAENSARVRAEFLANMSHEIRTPLTAVLGYTELLMRGSMDPSERARSLLAIDQSGRHLLQLLDDVLDLARIESGRYQIDPQPTLVAQLLLDVCSLLRVRAIEKGLALNLRYDSAVPESVITDSGRLRQILINLVGNAIKFTHEGSITIAVEFERESSPTQLVITVIDTGIGIEHKTLERIFLSFEQASSGTSRTYGGSGLGLAISRQLAQMLGGSISVTSTLQVGSSFRLTVGADPVSDTEWLFDPTAVAGSIDKVPTSQLTGRVLVVDDSPVNRALLRAFLTDFGIEVEEADNGQRCLLMVTDARQSNQQFDLILLDMQMPILDGYSAATQLRALDATLPIVAVTAHAMASDKRKCIDAGCTEYLTKPIRAATLYAMVSQFLPVRLARDPLRSIACADTVLADLMGDCVRDLHENTQLLGLKLADNDLRSAAEVAHRLKGTAATFGFPTIAAIAADVETLGRDNLRTLMPPLYDKLCDEIARIEIPPTSG